METREENEMEFHQELITPEKAKKILKNNLPYNRKVSVKVVELYARDMEEGRWNEYCPAAIAISSKGYLIDGQHRLLAVVKSGVPIVFTIATGVSENAFEYIDNGKKREAWQFLDGTQVKNRQAMAKFLCSLDMGNSFSQAIRGTITITRQELLEYENEHRDEIVEAVNAWLRIREAVGVGSNLAYGAALAVQSRLGEANIKDYNAERLAKSENFLLLVKTITRAYLSAKSNPNAAWVSGTMLQFIEAEEQGKPVRSFNKQEAMLEKYTDIYRKRFGV